MTESRQLQRTSEVRVQLIILYQNIKKIKKNRFLLNKNIVLKRYLNQKYVELPYRKRKNIFFMCIPRGTENHQRRSTK